MNLAWAVRRRALPTFIFSILLFGASSCSRGDRHTAPQLLSMPHAGGIVRVMYYPPPENRPSDLRLLLVHGPGHAPEVWEGLARYAAAAGIASLAMEVSAFRGTPTQDANASTGALEELLAVAQARPQGPRVADRLVLVAENAGAEPALRAVPVLRPAAVVLLSPRAIGKAGLSDALAAVSNVPVLAFSGEDDLGARPAMETLDAMQHDYLELRVYAGSAQGADMLAVYPAMIDQILHWIAGIAQTRLGPLGMPR